jgi:RecJ-like exonuclease
MIDKVEALVLKAQRAAEIIKPFSGEIRVVSHHDCDGICSAAILTKALLREGKRFRLSFVKQLTADVVESLAKEENRLIIFADMGSGQLDAVQGRLMANGGAAIILDHHQPQGEVLNDRLLHINTFVMGMGDSISGSGISYIVARAMSPENKDLSEMGVIGAIGDSQVDAVGADWGLSGVNKEILKDAQSIGKISVGRGLRVWGRTTRPVHKALEFCVDPYIPGVTGSESGAVHFLQELCIDLKKDSEWRTLSDLSDDELKRLASGIIRERVRGNHDNPDWIFGDVYTLPAKKELGDANEFATILNAAGKQGMGYLGMELCHNSAAAFEEVQGVLDGYRREIGRALDLVCREGNGRVAKTTTAVANYIIAGGAIPEHVISNVTSIVSRSGSLPEIPVFSFVDAEGGMTKISARLPDSMAGKVNLKEVMADAARAVGGEGGGHSNAAGGSIPRGAEQMFINRVETILTNLLASEDAEKTKESVDYAGGSGTEGSKTKGRESGNEIRRSEICGSSAERAAEAGEGIRPLAGKVEGQGLVRYICP